ncbi:hypothetical protein [Vagococcus allomyrinae]|nr:hypothetical protein [Vagococcus allomyrinae]
MKKNERVGWEFVRTGLSNGYANPKKTLGLNTVAIFKTTDLTFI